jgi:hypothetical protein
MESLNPSGGWLVVAADAGGPPDVQVFTAQIGVLTVDLVPFGPHFAGGIRVAAGDVNGDSIPDIVTAQGPGGDGRVRVFDGITGQALAGSLGSLRPFGPGYHGGVFVAVGDVNRDGFGDLIVSEDSGGEPRVKVFSGKDGSVIADFLAFDPSFRGGVRVAAANVNNNGGADVVAAAGPGGPPQVKVFEGNDVARGIITPTLSWNAFEPSFTGGVYVATGDVHGDGVPKIITGEGPGAQPRVNVFDGITGNRLQSFLAFDAGFKGGVRVAAADVNGDGRSDIIAAEGPGGLPLVRAFDGLSLEQVNNLRPLPAGFRGGVYVGGGGRWGVIHPLTQKGPPRSHVRSASSILADPAHLDLVRQSLPPPGAAAIATPMLPSAMETTLSSAAVDMLLATVETEHPMDSENAFAMYDKVWQADAIGLDRLDLAMISASDNDQLSGNGRAYKRR